jgi:hypothetical protein
MPTQLQRQHGSCRARQVHVGLRILPVFAESSSSVQTGSGPGIVVTQASQEAIAMAEWLYEIHRLNSVNDTQLGDLLREQGANGWELVQVLSPTELPDEPGYRLIFKSQKSQVAAASTP